MNVERAKRLGWIVDTLELQRSQVEEIFGEEREVLSSVPEGPGCLDIRIRCRRCCESLADALRDLEDAIRAITDARV